MNPVLELDILGRDSSPADELMAEWVRRSSGGQRVGYVPDVVSESSFRERSRAHGFEPVLIKSPGDFVNHQVVMVRTPADMVRHAWLRSSLAEEPPMGDGAASWSICTIVDDANVAHWAKDITAMLSAPVYPWDAVVCTSQAVRKQVIAMMRAQMDYLRQRMGVRRIIVPHLPVIPPGCEPAPEIYRPNEKEAARTICGAFEEDLVVLVRDRLDDVVALSNALLGLSDERRALVRVVIAGSQAQPRASQQRGERAGGRIQAILEQGDVSVTWVEADSEDVRQSLFAAADLLFMAPHTLADLDHRLLLAAMAAGLPVVCTDIGLASDLIDLGFNGFRVPVWCAPSGLDRTLAKLNANHGLVSLDVGREVAAVTALDIPALTCVLSECINDPALRSTMARSAWDSAVLWNWSKCLGRHVQMWRSLREQAATSLAKGEFDGCALLGDPLRGDPLSAQELAVTCVLDQSAVLRLSGEVDVAGGTLDQVMDKVQARIRLCSTGVQAVLPSKSDLSCVIEAARISARPARDLVNKVPVQRQLHTFRSLVWCVHVGLLEIAPDQARSATVDVVTAVELCHGGDVNRPLGQRE